MVSPSCSAISCPAFPSCSCFRFTCRLSASLSGSVPSAFGFFACVTITSVLAAAVGGSVDQWKRNESIRVDSVAVRQLGLVEHGDPELILWAEDVPARRGVGLGRLRLGLRRLRWLLLRPVRQDDEQRKHDSHSTW